jgi:glucose/arabinose dehydrogenase
MTIDQPYNNHNGGCLKFGPDGYLYIGMGDGGSAGDPQGYSQNVNSLLGKMLRIDVDNGLPYTVPSSNPFIGTTTEDEIWSIGLRNPWRFSFDSQNGDMWIGDVGQNTWEEIDYQPASSTGGENYGWRCYEGLEGYNTTNCDPQSTYVDPVAQLSHSDTVLSQEEWSIAVPPMWICKESTSVSIIARANFGLSSLMTQTIG